ncbi:MAG: methyltransferase domain-containing protein [Cyanobacteria bacterium P01_A01_bin.84]
MSDYKQQIIDFFNQRTAYDLEGDKHPREARLLLESVPIQPGQKILDIATGTGLVAIPAAKKVTEIGSVIGIDMSPGMLAQAKSKITVEITAEGLHNIDLIEADVESIDFEPEQFDVIFCCSAITYICDLLGILNKFHYWLKKGGYLAFTTPYKTAWMAEIKVKLCQDLFGIDLPHINKPLWTPEKCHLLLEQSGFEDVVIEIDPSGKYLYSNKVSHRWDGRDFYPRGNPLKDLSSDDREKLQAEYRKAIAPSETEKGIWLDTTTLYVKARR